MHGLCVILCLILHPKTNAMSNNKFNMSQRLKRADTELLAKLGHIVTTKMKAERVSLEAVASEMCITRGQLNRRVKAITGLTAQHYMLSLRLEHACRLLHQQPDMAVAEVALRCGFEDASSFSRAFRRSYGVSPTQFRGRQNNG